MRSHSPLGRIDLRLSRKENILQALPYFLAGLRHIGEIIAIVPKSARYVHGVEASLNTIYKSIIRCDINQQILSSEPVRVRMFLQDIFDQFKDSTHRS